MAATESSEKNLVNSSKVFKMLHAFLDDDGWYPSTREDEPFLLQSMFNGDHGKTNVYFWILEDREWFQVLVFAPFDVRQGRRAEVAEFLSRANYGLNFGAFQMDHRDGETHYKYTIDFSDLELSRDAIQSVIYRSTVIMDIYLPGLMGVVYGGMMAEEAILMLESVEATPPISDDELLN